MVEFEKSIHLTRHPRRMVSVIGCNRLISMYLKFFGHFLTTIYDDCLVPNLRKLNKPVSKESEHD